MVQRQKIRRLAAGAAFCALTFAATWIHVPTPGGGSVNAGDAVLLLTVWLFGGAGSVIAPALGATLADLTSGTAVYAPATVLIKALMALAALGVFRLGKRRSPALFRWFSGAAAEAVMILGYFLFECFFLRLGGGAVLNLPFNLIQAAVSVAFAVAGAVALRDVKFDFADPSRRTLRAYPMKLTGVTRSPIWGGTRLLTGWGKHSDRPTVGESWELTVRPDAVSTVENGIYAGKPLSEVLKEDRAFFLGRDCGDEFPLLIKLIDAHDRLSVQVHPDDEYAARVEHDRGKTEMWYIAEAKPDARIVYGIKSGTTEEELREAIAGGRIEDVLNYKPVREGDVCFIPAGLLHAIGDGILVAEIQQNCDLTYRVYDYGRLQPDGKPRELHVEKALDVTRPYTEEEINEIRYRNAGGIPEDENLLADCGYFRVEKITVGDGDEKTLPRRTVFRHLMCLDGEGTLTSDGVTYPLRKGDGYFLPAECNDVLLRGNAVCLLSGIPESAPVTPAC